MPLVLYEEGQGISDLHKNPMADWTDWTAQRVLAQSPGWASTRCEYGYG